MAWNRLTAALRPKEVPMGFIPAVNRRGFSRFFGKQQRRSIKQDDVHPGTVPEERSSWDHQ